MSTSNGKTRGDWMLPGDYNITPAITDKDVRLDGVQYKRNEGAYGGHVANTGCICNTSASHTYGNVMSVIEKYVLDSFPSVTFATITAATSLRSRQLNHLPYQLRKKETPILVISPRISFGQGDDRFLANTFGASRYNSIHSVWGDGSLMRLGYSREDNLYIYGHYNRALMFIDVIMTFDTYAEQVNMMSMIHNMLPVGHNQFLTAPLELYLPNNFCKLIGSLTHTPITNEKGSVYNFLRKMNTIWGYPITYKLKGGTNNNSFFMYYVTDIDTVIEEPQAGPGVKDGQVRNNFDISFTVRAEFNTIGFFTVTCPQIKKDFNVEFEADEDELIVPLLTDQIDLKDFRLPIGWTIYSWPIFKLDYGEDSISLDPLLNDSLNFAIEHHLSLGIPMDQFIRVEFREHGVILNNERFWIDWKNRVLHVINPDCHRTYRLVISVSPEYINNLIKEIHGLE